MPGVVSDGKWEDCGCPLSLAHRNSFRLDLQFRPHACLVSRDEWCKHYILDRHAYLRASRAPPASPLGRWIAPRLHECRLFVAKPPDRPLPPPEPWRFDEPPLFSGPLVAGWRYWEPQDDALALRSDGWTTPEMYDAMIDEFFTLLGVVDGLMRKQMLESGEAWLLACGNPAASVKVGRRHLPLKNDRVFVTADNEFFSLLMATLESKNLATSVAEFLGTLAVGERMKHLRRLLDVKIDAKIGMGGCGHVFNFM